MSRSLQERILQDLAACHPNAAIIATFDRSGTVKSRHSPILPDIVSALSRRGLAHLTTETWPNGTRRIVSAVITDRGLEHVARVAEQARAVAGSD